MAVFRRHNGDLRVEQDLQFVGVVTGTVTVCAAAHFSLDGSVMKDLIVHSDSTAIVRGRVLEDLRVQTDGRVVVRGTVMGNLIVQVNGSAIIHGNVRGTVLNEGGEVKILKQ
jgi:cytoskeletal protein CcmA (bactofilin family)